MIVNLQTRIDPLRGQFQPGRGIKSVMTDVNNNPVVLPSQFVAGTVIGFREVVAGLLWVRCDEFFHSGNFEAIVPLIRIITWLDPHQIDVYCVGAWHLAYNFVDSQQRADHRYMMPSVKLLEEGIQNNPGVCDPEFNLGFVIYQLKGQDFEKAIYWLSKASSEKDSLYYVSRALAHAYEKAGKLDEAVAQWKRCIVEGERGLQKNPKDYRAALHRDVSQRNLDGLLIRRVQRANLSKTPLDAKFEAKFQRLGPRVFRISGTTNLPDDTRIDIYLTDKDYKGPTLKSFTWQVDPTTTVLVEDGTHGILVSKGKFERRYDLSKDAKTYPFKKDSYTLTVGFNPQTAYINVQDRTGWSGEGITDKKYLDTSMPGLRKIKQVINLKREDLL